MHVRCSNAISDSLALNDNESYRRYGNSVSTVRLRSAAGGSNN